MAVRAIFLILGCTLALTIANPMPGEADWKFDELEKELKGVFQDDEDVKSVQSRAVEEVSGVTCGFFETIAGKSLFGYNTKTEYDVTSQECMELCAYEYSFYCRSADYNENSNTCYLSSESDETQPQDFGDNFNTIFYRRLCSSTTSTESPAESGSGWWYG